MGYKTASKAEVSEIAKQMVGSELNSAKESILSEASRLSEPRIVALAARLAKAEEQVQKVESLFRADFATRIEKVRQLATREELDGHLGDIQERFTALTQRIVAAERLEASLAKIAEKLIGAEEELGALDNKFCELRDGALGELLDEVREQAVQRDKELYRRIQELGDRTKSEISAEKEKLTRQFKENARIIEERRESVNELGEQVSKALSKYGAAYAALRREFEALKAGIKIGKGE